MKKQNQPSFDQRTKLDSSLYSLMQTESELKVLAVLFEHLVESSYSADELKGVSVILSRIGVDVRDAIDTIERVYRAS